MPSSISGAAGSPPLSKRSSFSLYSSLYSLGIDVSSMRSNFFCCSPSRYFLYISFYFGVGLFMNQLGILLSIAQFRYTFQVFTCYVCYLVPCSIAVSHLKLFDQYLYGLFFLAPLEIGGYALESSIAFPNNLIDVLFGVRNFSLFMVVFFALYIPLGNLSILAIESSFS
mmetsp:Transcript_3021/g.4432  ORF Transcript_3021/g.4432 Transcript_3021/m.4432 type:complete len:169 (-) Transcript_3021:6-512(-)